jgi:transcriptional regulator with XRE-family HTH domain
MSDDKASIERTAKRLRKARRDKHLTQVEVADRAGISETYYVQIEGAKKNPTTSIFKKIIKAIGVSSEEILGK